MGALRIPACATLISAIVLLAGVSTGEPAANDTCGKDRALEIVARVQARYDAIHDLSARFEQKSESVVLAGAALGDNEVSRGDVVFAKPGRMRWTYTEPEQSLVVSDGETMWIYDVAAQQVTRLPVQQDYLAGAAIQFLLGDGQIVESFHIQAEDCSLATVKLLLLPKQPSSYEKLGLTAEVESGLIRETTLVDLFGNRTRIRFDDIRTDQRPPDATFEFEVPEGVEVIDLELRTPGGVP